MVTGKESENNITTWPTGLERGTGKIAKSLSPEIDEPVAVYYFPGGWNYGHPTFHVIIEYGDMEQSDYKFMSLEEMAKTFNVAEDEIMRDYEHIVNTQDVKDYPNDQDFGKKIRDKFIK